MGNAKKTENKVSKKKIEKVKPKEEDKMLSANCKEEKSAMFLHKVRVEPRSSHHILKSI